MTVLDCDKQRILLKDLTAIWYKAIWYFDVTYFDSISSGHVCRVQWKFWCLHNHSCGIKVENTVKNHSNFSKKLVASKNFFFSNYEKYVVLRFGKISSTPTRALMVKSMEKKFTTTFQKVKLNLGYWNEYHLCIVNLHVIGYPFYPCYCICKMHSKLKKSCQEN